MSLRQQLTDAQRIVVKIGSALLVEGRTGRLRAATCAKKSSMKSRAELPPSKPRQRIRSPPTNS